MFDRYHEDADLNHEPVYLCNCCGEDIPHSELVAGIECPYCESEDLEEL